MAIEATPATTGEWDKTHEPVVVAVDGSDRNRSAVAWAAHEAAAHGCGLVLVTALHDHVVPRPHFSHQTREREVLDMLARVRAETATLVDEALVETRAPAGAPVEVLLAEAEPARLVVVGKRGLGGFARVLVGSTSIALAGRSPIPVAVVPDGWEVTVHRERPVVLGVDPFKVGARSVDVAFRRARRLRVPVVAVHGWETPASYTWDAAAASAIDTEAHLEADRRFDEVLATWTERYPDVVLRPMRLHKHPASAVLEAAQDAQLVVLGRHAAGIFGGFAIGSVARAVLHYAETPVVVVPAVD
ncbi:MAG TPA: universal stress protein [Nocardioidaceae bacterium]|nr:universal stress protein [Nocardioidaceae bacterium]